MVDSARFRGTAMKKLATAIAAITLIGTPAFAADIAVKAAAPSPAAVYNWTGFYVGGNIGASFGRAKTDFNVAPVSVTLTPPGGAPFSVPGFSYSDDIVEPSGFIGGGQIGYNWQFSPIWVVGLEADFQGADEKAGATLTTAFPNLPPGPGDETIVAAAATQYEAKIDWFGTVRGRIGYVWGDGAMLTYVTGGLAYGKVDFEATSTVSGTVALVPFSITHVNGHSQVNTGWTVGSGTEGRLLIPGWTYKIEYLYVDLGTLDDPDVQTQSTFASGGRVTTHTHFTDNIIRAGLNYQFH
jgi:outer membrane immunogenic protein